MLLDTYTTSAAAERAAEIINCQTAMGAASVKGTELHLDVDLVLTEDADILDEPTPVQAVALVLALVVAAQVTR